MNAYDPIVLRQDYMKIQSGEPRMRAIRMAITAAEQAKDDPALIRFHHDLIKDSVFSGDRYQALVDFPQYLAAAQRDPQLWQENIWDTLWMFKWIVEAATEFYQIDKPQILRWFAEYRRELLKNGFSLRTWYEKRAIFYQYADRAKMRMDYEDFLLAHKDDMGDGEASELNSTVRFSLECGFREKALDAAKQIFDRNLRTEEVPCKTYYYLLNDAMQQGNMQQAAQYAEMLRPLCNGQRFQLEPIGLMMEYDARNDPENGLRFYQMNRKLREGSRNPFLGYWFDRGAAKLLRAAAEKGCAPDADLLAADAQKYYENAKALAEKFDARNGSDYFTAHL